MSDQWQALLQCFSELSDPTCLPEGALALWLASHQTGQTVVLTTGISEAERLVENLQEEALLFPEIDMPQFHDGASEPQRLAVLSALASGRPVTVVTHLLAFLQPVAAPKRLRNLQLQQGQSIEGVLEKLESFGYRSARSVTQPGEFCFRGAILDLFPPGSEPHRLEIGEGRIEEIRRFDADSQRSQEAVPEVTVQPVSEPKREARLLDYLAPETRIVLIDPELLRERLERMAAAAAGDWKYSTYADVELLQNDRPDDWQELLDALQPRPLISLRNGPHQDFAEVPSLEGYAGFANWIVQQPRPWVWVTGRGRRVRANLTRRGLTEVVVVDGWLSRGFCHPKLGTVCTDREVFGDFRRLVSKTRDDSLAYPPDFDQNDLVVHRERGLGRFAGLVSVDVLGQRRDMLKVTYANEDSLLVPPDQIDLLTAYRSAREDEPKLSELGKASWGKTMEKARAAAQQASKELKKRRKARPAPAIAADTAAQEEMEEAFPYDETVSQLQAIEQIKRDLEQGHAMDRLLCGDVGFGKTEVSMRAAFKVAQSGLQVAVLVPTTVLAQQHTLEFRQRMGDWGLEVGTLFAHQEELDTLERLAYGSLKIVVGTHRLLAKDVRFAQLGLLIIDEEQQFGLAHKEKLRKLARGVHTLSMSATPIPRTLQLALSGVRDISLLDAPPERKRPIRTYLCEEEPKLVQAALIRELEREGQAFVLHNRVDELPRVQKSLSRALPGVRFGIAHGQMAPSELQQVLHDFREQRLDVLVCSTIIESGVNLPKVNTILIKDAHLFGLAQLYQIRGRVGRAGQQAYCYLFVPKNKELDARSRSRLETIRTMTQLGSGFEIARRDLEMRGAGDLLGETQTGSLNKVGYALFNQLLQEALAGEAPDEQAEPRIELAVQAYIPEEYLADTGGRIAIYQRVAGLRTARQLEKLRAELRDRYGPAPAPVNQLLRLAELRLLAAQHQARHIRVEDQFGETTLYADLTPLARLLPGQDPLEAACLSFQANNDSDLRAD
jgi:transcription-repair coupling factor (superfamily II helicase)